MDVFDAIKGRRSIRKYKPTPVSKEDLNKILEAARLAPSGKNTQPWNFIVVTNDETKQKMATANHKQKWIAQAPVCIACVADISARMKDQPPPSVSEDCSLFALKQVIRDTTIAIDHLVLQAEALGLGTCWLGWYEQKEMRPILGIPDNQYLVAIVTLGYADETPKPRPRRSFEDMVRYESWC